MKIVLIGYSQYWWNQCRILKSALKLMGHDVIFYDANLIYHTMGTIENYNYNTPIDVEIAWEHDLVFVCTTDNCYRILTDKPIVYFHTEYTWSPSCVNFNLLVSVFPECYERFVRRWRPLLKDCYMGFMWIKHFYIPEEYSKVPEKKQHGIFWMGATCTDGHAEWEQRTVYHTRAKIVGEAQSLGIIDSYMHDYSQNYLKAMSKWQGGLIVDANGSYFSPRCIELSAAGVIPCIYVGKDKYAREYYESAGFKHNETCWMFDTMEELAEFNKLDQASTQRILSTIRVLLEERYRYDKVLSKIFKQIEACRR